MSDADDPAVTLDAKLHRFVEGLTPDEVQVFNDLLEAWSEADPADVEGFTAMSDYQQAVQRLNQMYSLLGNIMQDQQKAVIQNLRA
jgi:hypothetical protein